MRLTLSCPRWMGFPTWGKFLMISIRKTKGKGKRLGVFKGGVPPYSRDSRSQSLLALVLLSLASLHRLDLLLEPGLHCLHQPPFSPSSQSRLSFFTLQALCTHLRTPLTTLYLSSHHSRRNCERNSMVIGGHPGKYIPETEERRGCVLPFSPPIPWAWYAHD